MVNENTLKAILKDLQSECHVPIMLFAAFKMDDLTDQWSIMVATEHVDQEIKKTIFSKLVELFARYLDEDERNTIARIGTFSPDDHLVELVMAKYKTGDHINYDQKINGNIIHEGYIALSNKSLQKDATASH